jgi:hypothetical protein
MFAALIFLNDDSLITDAAASSFARCTNLRSTTLVNLSANTIIIIIIINPRPKNWPSNESIIGIGGPTNRPIMRLAAAAS